jgi:hypothetical protein
MVTGAAQALLIAGAAIFGLLGSLHLAYTFFTDKFLPRAGGVAEAMKGTSPVLTRQITMWDAWVGFNGSHSLGAILFGAVYLILATQHMELLAHSRSLLLVAVVTSAAYLWLAYTYWFRIPLAGIAAATTCFVSAFLLLTLQR